MAFSDDLKSRARELGFAAVGATSAEPFREAEAAALERTAQGMMDGLPWWNKARVRASADPRQRTPAAQSVLALAFPYPVPSAAEADTGDPSGRIAAYALGRDYHEVLSERMQPLVTMLRSQGHQAKTYVDHGWMLDRAAGARAGLGWLGKNTNLLVPGVGSYVLLSEIVTSAELEPDGLSAKSCGKCEACLQVCPTGALVAPGVLDNRKCISFWTIEHHGVIPLEMRPLMGTWIFGCDLCQEVCPVNAYPRRAEPDPAAIDAHGAVSEQVAAAMASGVRSRLQTEIALSITGIAGPAGGTPDKPVGTVWIALDGQRPETLGVRLFGDRREIRERAAQAALDLVRRQLQSG